MIQSKNSRPLVVLTIFMGFLVSFIFTAKGGFSESTFGDSADYINSARSVFSNEGFYRGDSTWPFFRPPGYPFTIAITWFLVGSESIIALKILNLVLHLSSTFLLFRLANIRFSQRASIFSASFFLFNPFTLMPLSEVQTETITTFLFISFVLLILAQNSFFTTAALCFVSVYLVAVRPEYLIFLALTVICILAIKSTRREYLSKILILTTCLILSLSWWGFQNKKATGDFILLTNAGSYFLWNGSTDLVLDNYAISLRHDPNYDKRTYEALQKEISDLKTSWGKEFEDASTGKKSSYWFQAYTENVKQNPTRYVLKTFEKGVVFIRPFLNPRSHGLEIALMSLIVLLPMTISVSYVIFDGLRKKIYDPAIGIMIIGFISVMLVHMLQMPDQRYKMPVFVPLFAYSSGGIAYALSQKIIKLKVSKSYKK
jgi:hypothetical protein